MSPEEQAKTLILTSNAFSEGEAIPVRYTCKGENINPPFTISNVPEGTKSLALIMHDPDAPNGDFTHWLAWNIDPETLQIAENSPLPGSVQGTNGSGNVGYMGPCPPSGTHHYIFELYALSTTFDLPPDTNQAGLQTAISGNIVDETKLTGVFSAS